MTSEIASLVLRAALFAGLAVLAVLCARRPLRRWLGAQVAYQAWLVAPLATAAAMLPDPGTPPVLIVPAMRTVHALAAQAAPLAAPRVDLLLVIWLLGVVASAAWFVLGHQTFVRAAGRLTKSGDVHVSDADVGPASIGLFSLRIIVPHDFAQRYSPLEQSLVIAHERIHIARHDAVANLAAALFQCAFWFNPLVHLGVRRFRQDQELSCDVLTIRDRPRARRAYAEALLKFHGAYAASAGINCHWQTHHPTKERLMNLQQTPPGTVRRLAGRCLVVLLAVGAISGTLGARAHEPDAPTYAVAMQLGEGSAPSALRLYAAAMQIDAGDATSTPRVLTRAGEAFAVASAAWRVEMVVREAQTPGTVWLAGKIFKDDKLLGAPTLLTRLNEPATVRIDDSNAPFTLTMTVSTPP